MNIALGSIIIILLLLPAIFFRTFIINSDSLENPLDTSIKTELGIVFLIAVMQHLIGYCILSIVLRYQILFEQLYFILQGESKSINSSVISFSLPRFLIYTVVQVIFAVATSIYAKSIIIKNYWDIRTNFFPISNEWDKLLSGRIYEYDRIQKINTRITELREYRKSIKGQISKGSNIKILQKLILKRNVHKEFRNEINHLKKSRKTPDYNYVEVDVLVNTSNGDYIYKGRVFKYYLAKDNTLDKIILKYAFRRKFIYDEDAGNKPEFYEFDSKLFVIKYSEIKNLNVRFTFYEEENNI